MENENTGVEENAKGKEEEIKEIKLEKISSEADSVVEKNRMLETAKKMLEERKKLNSDLEKFEREKSEFLSVMSDYEKQGRSFAGNAVSESDEDKARREARKLLKGTGFEDRI